MSGLVYSTLDVFICASILADHAAQVNKPVYFLDFILAESNWVELFVVYPHNFCLPCIKFQTRLLSLLCDAVYFFPVLVAVCGRED